MDLAQYMHERDIYYVVKKLHETSLAMSPPYKWHTYNLFDNRSMRAPRYKEQRIILKALSERKIIEISLTTNRLKRYAGFETATTYTFRRTNLLSTYFWELLHKIEEANLNQISITEYETVRLSIEGEYIYVQLPLLKLRINERPFKTSGLPQQLFEHLLRDANEAVVTRDNFPFNTSRTFDDVVIKAGFEKKLRSVFVPKLTKNKVQLLVSCEVNLKDIVEITKQLLPIPYNQTVYDHYTEGLAPKLEAMQ